MAGSPGYEGGGYENYGSSGEGPGSEFREKMEDVAQGASSRMQDVRQSVSDAGAHAKDVAYQQMEHLRQVGSETAQRLEDRIRNDPIKACLIVAGCGLGLGFLLGAMWSHRD